jgi:hypothetical protein
VVPSLSRKFAEGAFSPRDVSEETVDLHADKSKRAKATPHAAEWAMMSRSRTVEH